MTTPSSSFSSVLQTQRKSVVETRAEYRVTSLLYKTSHKQSRAAAASDRNGFIFMLLSCSSRHMLIDKLPKQRFPVQVHP